MDNHEEQYNCDECNNTVKGYHRFCHHCGAYLGVDAEQISIFNNQNLRAAFFFYVIYLFICLMVSYTDWFHTYDTGLRFCSL